MKAVKDLLQDHRQLENSQHLVIGDLRHIASSARGVTLEETTAVIPSWPGSECGKRRSAQLRSAQPTPVAKRESNIYQRIADGTHLPIEYRFNLLSRPVSEHHVVELVVVVDDGGSCGLWHSRCEPRNHAVHLRFLFDLRPAPALAPAAHLPFQEAFRLSQRNQAGGDNVDGMQAGKAIDESLTDDLRMISNRLNLGWDSFAQNASTASLHQVEDRPDDGHVLTQVIYIRSFGKMRMYGLQHMKFARHVVSFGRDRTKRTASQHKLFVAALQQVGEIRMSSGELLDRNRVCDALNFPAQILAQDCRIQFFALADSGSIGMGRSGNHASFTTILPILAPCSMSRNACGAFSRP